VKKKGAEVIDGGVFPGNAGAEIPKALQGDPVSGQGMRRDVFLSLQVKKKLTGQQISTGLGAGLPVRGLAAGLFQERAPIGTSKSGWAVSSTLPLFSVPRSNRRIALRVSKPSGEVATMGIS